MSDRQPAVVVAEVIADAFRELLGELHLVVPRDLADPGSFVRPDDDHPIVVVERSDYSGSCWITAHATIGAVASYLEGREDTHDWYPDVIRDLVTGRAFQPSTTVRPAPIRALPAGTRLALPSADDVLDRLARWLRDHPGEDRLRLADQFVADAARLIEATGRRCGNDRA